jgi:hypothetical protein
MRADLGRLSSRVSGIRLATRTGSLTFPPVGCFEDGRTSSVPRHWYVFVSPFDSNVKHTERFWTLVLFIIGYTQAIIKMTVEDFLTERQENPEGKRNKTN